MKKLRAKARVEAFTLIELLVVIVIIAIVAAMLMPLPSHPPRLAYSIRCMKNQKQIAIGFTIWSDDNSRHFPWQISTTNSGAIELIANNYVASQFQTLSNYLKTNLSLFTCPTDKARHAPKDYQTMSNQNFSYFVNVDASTNTTNTILTGDRHLQADGNPVRPGVFAFTNGMAMGWTHELHGSPTTNEVGVMAFADGHAQIIKSRDSALTEVFRKQNLPTSRLLVP